eukprot:scaffold26188_cov21-Prasinocladus_malaysianus.AAC.1
MNWMHAGYAGFASPGGVCVDCKYQPRPKHSGPGGCCRFHQALEIRAVVDGLGELIAKPACCKGRWIRMENFAVATQFAVANHTVRQRMGTL